MKTATRSARGLSAQGRPCRLRSWREEAKTPTEEVSAGASKLLNVRPPAIVVDVGFVNGLSAIRSLRRAGVRVFAVDHKPSALGFRSRYATKVVAPSPLADEDGFVEALRALGPGVVFATHDEGLRAIARHRDSLDLLCPFPRDLERLQKKRVQLEAALDTPDTRYPESAAEAVAAAEEIGYPVLLKPSEPVGFRQQYGKQAVICHTASEVEEAYGQIEPWEPMVQDLIPGGDDELYTLGAYLSESLEPLGLFCGRKLIQTPPGIGTARARRGGLGRRGRGRGAAPAARARLQRALAGRVQARPARREVQADGGEPASLAVALARTRERRRPAPDRVPRPDRRAGRGGADERRPAQVGDPADARRAPGRATAPVRRGDLVVA